MFLLAVVSVRHKPNDSSWSAVWLLKVLVQRDEDLGRRHVRYRRTFAKPRSFFKSTRMPDIKINEMKKAMKREMVPGQLLLCRGANACGTELACCLAHL